MFNFGDAVKAIKEGKKAARKGWNGKGMFIYYVPAGRYVPCTDIAKSIVDNQGLVVYAPYIALNTGKGYVIPWTVSQEDALSEDWEIVE